MKQRDKVLISVTLIACCISLMFFAFFSLARLLTSSVTAMVPMVDQLSHKAADELAPLNTVPNPVVSEPPLASRQMLTDEEIESQVAPINSQRAHKQPVDTCKGRLNTDNKRPKNSQEQRQHCVTKSVQNDTQSQQKSLNLGWIW